MPKSAVSMAKRWSAVAKQQAALQPWQAILCSRIHQYLLIATGIDESELKDTDMSQETKDIIFKNDLDALDAADLTVALLTGQDIDSGTSAEIGHTFAKGKPVIAINANERRYRNLFVEGMLTVTVNNIDEIIPEIKKLG